MKRNRYVHLTGATKSVNRALEAKNRALAGIKAYITNLPNPDPEQTINAYSHLALKQVLTACPHLDAVATHIQEFARILTGRHGQDLDAWMAAVDADDLPHLHRFVNGLRRDTLPSATDSHSRTAPARSKATSTASR